ncbi:MAG: type II toxin-antitoxin system PemK/MazF family toxin [Acidimicrobiales bacterium]
MNRGEVWLAQVGRKRRPVLVLTRTDVIAVRTLVTVAEITSSIRGISAEVLVDHQSVGLDRESAVNCDGLHTVTQASLTRRVGQLDDLTMEQVCVALNHALDC